MVLTKDKHIRRRVLEIQALTAAKARAFVLTGVEKPFDEREFPLPEVEPDAILVRMSAYTILM